MKRWGTRVSVLAVLCTILFFPLAVFAQESLGVAQPAEYPEGLVHAVVKGDTLWDLSAKYLGSPWLWPDLWERNRFITNPHYIYPGINVVVFPPPPREYGWEVKESASVPEGEPAVSTPEGTASHAAAPTTEAPPATAALNIPPEEFVRAGEFTQDRPTGIGRIEGGWEDKDAFSEADKIYLSLDKEIPEDQILGVYRVRGPVKSHTARPVSGYVRFLVGVV
ncbi:MAG: LysM peptidoglycan-binding domain-containing protein, partial [Thermodesulfobacteriota bacterium]|nr:LysM peptidoglycan-binding domain-containing protein [Thermodesulfobacteriota bacterium]